MSLQNILHNARMRLLSDPFAKEMMISQMCKVAIKRITNLRTVERSDEARKIVLETSDELIKYWKSDVQNPIYIHAIALLYIETEDFDYGVKIIKVFTETLSCDTIDLTTCYLDLGRLYSLLGGFPMEELECYVQAYKSVGPPNGKFPATRKDKAKCCYCIFKLAEWLQQDEIASLYRLKCESLVDGVKLNYEFAANDFFADRRDEPTPEVVARVNTLLKGYDILL